MPRDPQQLACQNTAAQLANRCPSVFDRVSVSYLQRGGSTIHWELISEFSDPLPYTFQLQVAQFASTDDEDWINVGSPTTAYYAVDPDQHSFGKINRTTYRVMLTTPTGVYCSTPVSAAGTLPSKDWRIARELMRKELLRLRAGHSGQRGFLLKRRITGENCRECLDHLTEEVTNPRCPNCYGTGKHCGYYRPVECVWAEFDPKTYRTHLDAGQARGTVNDIVVKARMINTWFLGEEDLFINDTTDDRFYIHTVQNVIEIRGIPIVANVEMRPAPVTDVAYDIVIPGYG